MTKQEAMRQMHQQNVLMELGFTADEADKLRRISMTLRSWHERECGIDGGCIERENDDGTGRAFWLSSHSGKRWPIRDMETGALRRLNAIVARRNNVENAIGAAYQNPVGRVSAYIQGDPRGAALYIIRPGDIPAGQTVDSCYSRGIVVY